MLFWGMPEQPKTVVDPGIDRRRGYTIFFTIIYINDSWHIQPPICSRGTLMTSQGSETVTAMFWQNGITVITRAR